MTATPRSLLFSWIGDADLLSWAATVGGDIATLVSVALNKPVRDDLGDGPIKTLVDQVNFDEVHLISDKDASLSARFSSWIGARTSVHTVSLPSPIDYAAIFEAADAVLGKVISSLKGDRSISIHLSPGTPAMAAIWVLLGKSRYPATFYQTHRGEVIPTKIPFDLLVDYVPGVLHASDRLLESPSISDLAAADFAGVIGKSPAIRNVIARAGRMALRDVGVLLLGESGVGKELFAKAIHNASRRKEKPFVALNCAAVPKDLLESELFGHVKGAFSGAHRDRAGAFEQAHTGTLFLDEVGECDLSMQAKLLRVLQPGPEDPPAMRTFRRVGDAEERTADVRIIAATNRDLHAEIAAGRFREDLLYRLATLTVKIPPLRARTPDIPSIAEHLLTKINRDFGAAEPGYQDKRLSVKTKRFLCQQPWPGNVRQLHNALLQAAVMSDGAAIEPAELEAALLEGVGGRDAGIVDLPLGEGFSLTNYLEDVQRRYLARAMKEAEGKKTVAAKLLGYPSYQTLAAQLDRLKVDWRSE